MCESFFRRLFQSKSFGTKVSGFWVLPSSREEDRRMGCTYLFPSLVSCHLSKKEYFFVDSEIQKLIGLQVVKEVQDALSVFHCWEMCPKPEGNIG